MRIVTINRFKFELIICIFLFGFVKSNAQLQLIPEFNFNSPQLIYGSPNQDGAVYRFYNIAPGYDATVRILGRSSSAVVLDTIDLSPTSGYGMGYEKALQPRLGIPGTTPANASWWMKFQIDFLKAGKNKSANIAKFKATAIDVDGDSYSVAENVKAYRAISAAYASPSYLAQSALISVPCGQCGILGLPITCTNCGGSGYLTVGLAGICQICNGAGLIFSTCGHNYTGQDISVQGPVDNAPGIDTASIANMVTFTYVNTSTLIFQYGATSKQPSNGGGMRLNSIFLKAFSLTSSTPLPLEILSFNANSKENRVSLNWTIAKGLNFSMFNIERSIDGSHFNRVGSIESIGLATNFSYSENFNSINSTVFYYRLKILKTNGEALYSQIKKLELSNFQEITAFPNPCSNKLNIELPHIMRNQIIKIQLFTRSGIMVRSMEWVNSSGNAALELSSLLSGIYFLKISNQKESFQKAILKS